MNLLPLGTIIKVNKHKLCIIGYATAEKDSASVAGYFVVSYPLGFINTDKMFFIPHNQEDLEIIAEGYKTEDSEKFLVSAANVFEKICNMPREHLLKTNHMFSEIIASDKEGNKK